MNGNESQMGKEKKEPEPGRRRHAVEFKVKIAERMLAGENVAALAAQHELPRSMMYRWREAYRKEGRAGLARPRGRPPGGGKPVRAPGQSAEEKLREQVAELERLVGRQAAEIAFFRGVFKRLDERPPAPRRGGKASTPKSNG